MRIINIFLLALSVFFITTGWYLLTVSPEMPFEEIIMRAKVGVFLNIAGGVLIAIYFFMRSR